MAFWNENPADVSAFPTRRNGLEKLMQTGGGLPPQQFGPMLPPGSPPLAAGPAAGQQPMSAYGNPRGVFGGGFQGGQPWNQSGWPGMGQNPLAPRPMFQQGQGFPAFGMARRPIPIVRR